MPHEVWQVVKTFSESKGLAQDCVDVCKFVMDWCVVADQATAPDKGMFLAFGLDSVTEQDSNVSLAAWLEAQLDTTFPLTKIQCARLAWRYITRQRKRSWTGPSLAVQLKPASHGLFWR